MKQSRLMQSPRVQLAVLALFSVALALPLVAASTEDSRSIVLLPVKGSTSADLEILRWQERLSEKPANSSYWERLGWAYIAKARWTQDAGFYKLAELTATAWESACGPSSEARLLRGHVYHNLHRFAEAESIGRDLVKDRKAPADYALLCDALMEQGKLDEAVQVCQTLANLRPGVESDSRVAHLRWLYGDLPGAVEAVKMALRAVDPQDSETRAWLYTRLAGYHLLAGQALPALQCSETALGAVPEYPAALAQKGRALYSAGNYDQACSFLRRAEALNPIPDNQWWLADALRQQGQLLEAGKVEAKLRRFGGAVDPRTVALFLATRGDDVERAVLLSTEELNNRSDIYTHDAVGFALLRASKKGEAAAEMKLALARQTNDPRLNLHAGILAEANGDQAEANRFFSRAKPMAAALTPSEQALLTARTSHPLVAIQ